MAIECVITGCSLLGEEGFWYPGDLFALNDTAFIFNGNAVGHEQPQYRRQIKLREGGTYWCRRSVYIARQSDLLMNREAKDYFDKNMSLATGLRREG